MTLNDSRNTPGYVCGRIIAAYELIAAQVGQNLPLNDLNLSATHPVHTIPRLRAGQIRKALARTREQNPEGVARVEAYIADLVARLDHFPQSLDSEQRAEYVLGEAHQKVVGLPF
ncbi:type I-C CRISPR-associated protein Cas8c/Csd1 [Streptomyces graminilatus]|uniref:type I-C CRISPR-associated protein Cas8c/Csd1 n=1 Tax=Streptomyces graminilatus TaxID=1464070 RepID=UPI0006E15AF1|nr:type I-C CRISPR-associated protein Cas8c/Csd1 [Streptomyces graminilatus]